LLLLLEELRARLGIRLAIAHFNHHLRGQQSDEDEQFVRQLAESLGLECCVGGAEVAEEARKARANLEDTARRLRYAFFARMVAEGRATRVAVAHTADDQAETVLAHLLRGTGPAGLGGIYPQAGTVVRPLLEIRRSELQEYLRARKQPWREDQSNLDLGRTRARIRQLLLPLLEAEFQPTAVEHLARLAALAREDERFWKLLVEERYAVLVAQSNNEQRIVAQDLLAPLRFAGQGRQLADSQEALARRLVRRIISGLKRSGITRPERQLTAKHVEDVLRLARCGRSGQKVELPGGVRAEREFDRLVFSAAAAAQEAGKVGSSRVGSKEYAYQVHLDPHGGARVEVVELGKAFCLKVIDWPTPGGETMARSGALDRGLLHPPLVLRNWRAGDAYWPQGRAGVLKLKRLLLAKRVGLRQRAGWPVLTSNARVVWAKDLPVAAEFAARQGTRNAVLIIEESL
jgi:tRNA(Ile)-lysidine synthase